jgi:hypothetical protein
MTGQHPLIESTRDVARAVTGPDRSLFADQFAETTVETLAGSG